MKNISTRKLNFDLKNIAKKISSSISKGRAGGKQKKYRQNITSARYIENYDKTKCRRRGHVAPEDSMKDITTPQRSENLAGDPRRLNEGVETITIPQTLVAHYATAHGLKFEDAALELVGKAIGRILGQDCPIHKKPPKGLEAEFEWVEIDLSGG